MPIHIAHQLGILAKVFIDSPILTGSKEMLSPSICPRLGSRTTSAIINAKTTPATPREIRVPRQPRVSTKMPARM